ncbi:hypothetical protein CDD80_5684 [Ophiocordyceps camponoti-rufipedis]|uniref:Inclusion body clearance protein IML2 n=1 Tax=Ophiocordyceps camponoti-rufipedis TaxID=2004952 RepID=A0A2C5YVC2_9HYPO|nr:hypothetical protein CDD80_5684 [Ophiocordyceps camponoti-rufipedis]
MALTSWFRSSTGGKDGGDENDENRTSAKERREAKQRADLADALRWMNVMMDDELDRASDELAKNDSCFHRYASAVALFLRSILGLEKSVLTETASALAELETAAWDEAKAAQRAAAADGWTRAYRPGTEYDVIRAQAQLMGAVLGVLQESLVEAMRSFYKLRRAYVLLESIVDGDPSSGSSSEMEESSTDDSLATDTNTDTTSATTSLAKTSTYSPGPDDPIDDFIRGSAATSFGLILLLLSLTPPAFSRILSAVGFGGDRTRGVRLLWRSAARKDISGAFSGMLLLGYYNVLLGGVDIMPGPEDNEGDGEEALEEEEEDEDDPEAQALGPPRARCRALLSDMRSRYPKSQLWRIEEARMLAGGRQLADAIALLRSGPEPRMKQVAAVSAFELGICALAAQEWQLAHDTFARCVEISGWSPAMYDYMAGCASLELYRDGGPDAESHKAEAEKLLRRAPSSAGKKRLLARQIPVEVFLQRRVRGWEARASALGVDLVDAVGVSPAVEMCYVWNTPRRMNARELRRAVEVLDWGRCKQGAVVEAIRGDRSEVAAWAVNMAALLRAMGKLQEAKTLLEKEVESFDRQVEDIQPS